MLLKVSECAEQYFKIIHRQVELKPVSKKTLRSDNKFPIYLTIDKNMYIQKFLKAVFVIQKERWNINIKARWQWNSIYCSFHPSFVNECEPGLS